MRTQYKLVSSLEKVYPDQEPAGEEGLSLEGLQKETVSFQIAVYNDVMGKERVSAAVESVGEGLQVRVRAVQLVPCAYPCHQKRDEDYDRTVPGLYPDLLEEVPVEGVPVPSGQWRSLWIDVKIPEGLAGGEYAVSLALLRKKDPESADLSTEEVCQLHVPVRVIGAVLPPLSIPHTEWFHCDCLANYYGVPVFSERHWEIIENFVRTAAERGMNMLLTPVFTPPLDTAFGGERTTAQLVDVAVVGGDQYEFGFDKLHRWIDMCRRCGITYLEISHLFSQWGAVAAPKVMGVRDGQEVQLFGWDTDAAGEQYRKFLHQFLTALKKVLREEGMLDHTYFHISDEPNMSQLESYKAALEGVKEDLADCRRFDALSDYEFYRQGLVPVPVCSSNHIAPFLENRPKELWTYYCTAQYEKVSNRFIAMPGYRTRVLGAQLYRNHIDGFLQWGYNFYNSDLSLHPINPFEVTDAEGSFPSGDPFIVYPGPDGRPEESLRLMLMDEAFSDFRAMTLLESMVGRQAVLDLVADIPLAMDEYPKSVDGVEEIRRRINEAIRAQVEQQENRNK